MNEDDAHALALLVVRRRDEEAKVETGAEQREGEARAPGQHGGGEAQEAGRVGEAVHGGHLSRSRAPGKAVEGRPVADARAPRAHSSESLSAAALAQGASTSAPSRKPPSTSRCGLAPKPVSAASTAETPKISTGM